MNPLFNPFACVLDATLGLGTELLNKGCIGTEKSEFKLFRARSRREPVDTKTKVDSLPALMEMNLTHPPLSGAEVF